MTRSTAKDQVVYHEKDSLHLGWLSRKRYSTSARVLRLWRPRADKQRLLTASWGDLESLRKAFTARVASE